MDPLCLQGVLCPNSTHRDHHQGPPGHSRHWHRAHTEFVLNLGLSGAELFSCKIKCGPCFQVVCKMEHMECNN